MANTKKTVVEDIENIEGAVEDVVTKPAKKAKRPQHDPDEYITCRSVVFGELILIGPKTGMKYKWVNQGDTRDVTYQDLAAWKALGSNYLFAPMIIIEDEKICEEWESELGDLYNTVQEVDLKAIFNLPHRQFVSQIKQLPSAMKSSIQNMAYAMIQDKSLYDLRKIEAIDTILGTDLKMMI